MAAKTDKNSAKTETRERVPKDPAANFVFRASRAGTEAIQALQKLGRVGSFKTVSYGEEQVDKIFAKIQAELDKARKEFVPRVANDDSKGAPLIDFGI